MNQKIIQIIIFIQTDNDKGSTMNKCMTKDHFCSTDDGFFGGLVETRYVLTTFKNTFKYLTLLYLICFSNFRCKNSKELKDKMCS